MKKILLFILLCPLFAHAQKLPDFGFDKVRIVTSDKIIQTETLPVSSDPDIESDRFYYWYSAGAIHSTQGGFSGTLLNGSYNEYYLDKNLKQQGIFNKGLKDGIWKSWSDNGTLTEMYTWKEGLRSGKFELFDDQGHLKQSGFYKADVLVVKKDSSSFWRKLEFFHKKK